MATSAVSLAMVAGLVALGLLGLWAAWKLTQSLLRAGFWVLFLLALAAAAYWILAPMPASR